MAENPTNDPSGPEPSNGGAFSAADPSDDLRARARRSLAAFAAIAALVAFDLLDDAHAGIELRHVLVEGVVLALAAAGIALLWRAVLQARSEASALRGEVASWRAAADRWRGESRALVDGLGVAIERQFERWSLTEAEREVALLLVKGLSLAEVARARATSERTVRQQAQAVYRKAGVAGRAELSAFFLEDLLLPGSVTARPPGA